MAAKTLDDLDLADKRVLIRVDINVPVERGQVADATRIERIAPTVADVLAKGGRPILLAHFGRPKGQPDPEMSLAVTRDALSTVLKRPILFAEDCVGPEAEAMAARLRPGQVLLLENLRFHPGEERNDPEFAQRLARLGEVYVNDAFSAAHRAHASTEALARLLPAAAGRGMQQELEALEAALGDPERPLTAVVGGAKVSTKLDLLGNLVKKVDRLVIGGGMANTFLAAQGINVGKSLCEHDLAETARAIMATAREAGCEILLPEDVAAASAFEPNAPHQIVAADACPAEAMILDAGPKTVAAIDAALQTSKTVVWNGPLGAFELEPFDQATVAAARRAAELTAEGRLRSVAGGGDTVAALNHAGAAERFSYVSTAGGAFLEWLEGKTLPGVAALEQTA